MLTSGGKGPVHDGLPQEGWHEEQTGETLLPDDALAFEADTLDELRAALAAAGLPVPGVVPAASVPPRRRKAEWSGTMRGPYNKELERTRSTHFAVSPRRSIQCWTDRFMLQSHP